MELILANCLNITIGGGKYFDYCIPTPIVLKLITKMYCFTFPFKSIGDHLSNRNSDINNDYFWLCCDKAYPVGLVLANCIVDDCIDEFYGPLQIKASKALKNYVAPLNLEETL